MKIAIAMLTRENPTGLICAIQALDAMSSRQHEIKYFVRYDYDDYAATEALELLETRFPVVRVLEDRPFTLGQAWNQCIAATQAFAPDAVCVFGDDVFPTVQGWDVGIKAMIEDRGFEMFSWRELANPTNITYPVVSKRWLEEAGKLFPEWFPYWFTDTWISQVYELAKGSPVAIATDMTLGGRWETTRGMREVAFWVEFWKATRSLRVAEAHRMRMALGWPEVDEEPVIRKFKRLDACLNPEAIEAQRSGVQGPPSERYLEAKGRAEQWLADNPPEPERIVTLEDGIRFGEHHAA